MIGAAMFLTFFTLFTLASLVVPIPLFPGNMVTAMLPTTNHQYDFLISALVNGVTYGLIVWLVFIVGNKKLSRR